MLIKTIQIEYAHKNGMSAASCEGLRHIKALPYLSVVQAAEGSYDIRLGKGEMYSTGAGGFFIAPASIQQTIIHHTDRVSGTMSCRWVFLKIKVNERYDFDDLYELPVIIPDLHKQAMYLLFDRLFAADNVFDEYICYYELVKLLSLLSQKKAHKASPYLDRVLAYIKEYYPNKITIGDLAREVSLSEAHLFSVFKQEMGTSPLAYINHYRLSVAADELLKTDKSVVEIANTVGISDPIYFGRLFRKAYQMPPGKYREMYKKGVSSVANWN